MNILSIDTATKSCSVAIASEDSLLAEATMVKTQTHSKHLMRMIDQVLKMAQIEIRNLDGFSVTKGPGSFTGLRIGISVAKGFAAASGKPFVGISTLEALAYQAGNRLPLVCPMIDARRGEVYCSRYRYDNGIYINETSARALPVEKALVDLKEPCVFIGNGALFYRSIITETLGSSAFFAPRFYHTIRATTVASLSLERFLRQDTDDVEAFVPYYIRKSDAELNFDKKKLKHGTG